MDILVSLMCRKSITMTTLIMPMLTIVLGSWANDLGGMLSRSCMYGFGIHGVTSKYDEDYGDRLWQIECKQINQLDGRDICAWTFDFVNEYGKRLKYSCDGNQYISGLYADYNSSAHDRIWRVECCSTKGVDLMDCEDTDWMNKYGTDLNLELKPKQVIRGVTSVYKPEQRDRKWKFNLCDVKKTKDSNNDLV